MRVLRTIGSVAGLVVLASGAMLGLGWSIYEGHHLGWPIARSVSYAKVFLAAVILVCLGVVFVQAKRNGASGLGALGHVAITLVTCVGVVFLSGIMLGTAIEVIVQ